MLSARDTRNFNQLESAIAKGKIEEVRALITQTIDLKTLNNCYLVETPLHLAVIHRRAEVLKLLLDSGAQITGQDRNNSTALQLALDRGDLQMAMILIEAGAGVDTKSLVYGWTALHLAAEKNEHEVIVFLLPRGSSVNDTDRVGWTPLHHAAYHNVGRSHINTIKVLLDYHADVETEDLHGKTPFHLLLRCKDESVNVELVRMFAHLQFDKDDDDDVCDETIME